MSGAAPVLVPGEPPRIDRFRIAAEIGRGTASVVYLAMDTREGAWRALKVLAFERMGDESARARFRREGEAALRLRHPHLVRAWDADTENPFTPWVAFEVCEAGSLQDWIDRHGRMPAFLSIEVLVQVCSALAAAHRANVAQRRLEPRDVLVDRHGKCRLKDFRSVPGGGSGFASDSPDLRNDLVGAGTLLHTLVTGQPPVGTVISGGVPDPLRGVIQWALQRGRGQGYPDAASMGRDLEAAMLELSLPASGSLPSLVEGDARLPDSVEAVFDPEQTFEDLERAARWAADPAEGPPRPDPNARPLIGLLSSTGRPAARRSSPTPAPPPPAPAPELEPLPPETRRHLPEAVLEAAAAPFARGTPAPSPYRSVPHGRLTDDELRRRGDLTPAPIRRGAGGDLIPSYVVEEPIRPERSEAWREGTPPPIERVEPKTAPVRVDPRLVAAAAVLVAVLVVGTFFKGAQQVHGARATASSAGENLTAVVAAAGAAVNDLAVRGADRQRLEEAFFAHSEARGAARYDRADAFAALLLAEAARVGVDPSAPVKDAATQRISEINDAHARYHAALEAWAETASAFPGVLPVTLGLAKAPPKDR